MDQGHDKFFCFGLGYSARILATRLLAAGWRVAGTCQDATQCHELRAMGIDAYVFDRTHPLEVSALRGATHVLSSVPPDLEGDAVIDCHRDTLAHLNELVWAGYLSTTGVYGDTDGRMVDETSPVRPTVMRSRQRGEAEKQWMELWRDDKKPVHIFRLAGIYGPGRNPFERIRADRAKMIDKPGHLFSRIHVDDIATVVSASMHKPNPGAIYNVCDDTPATPAEVTAFACALLGKDPPPLISYDEARLTMSAMAQTFWSDNRRVDNRKIKEELGVSLAYPDFKTGLRAILRAEKREP